MGNDSAADQSTVQLEKTLDIDDSARKGKKKKKDKLASEPVTEASFVDVAVKEKKKKKEKCETANVSSTSIVQDSAPKENEISKIVETNDSPMISIKKKKRKSKSVDRSAVEETNADNTESKLNGINKSVITSGKEDVKFNGDNSVASLPGEMKGGKKKKNKQGLDPNPNSTGISPASSNSTVSPDDFFPDVSAIEVKNSAKKKKKADKINKLEDTKTRVSKEEDSATESTEVLPSLNESKSSVKPNKNKKKD